MADPIEVNYTPDGDDWTVSVTGRGQTLTGRAPGLIAARDRADQLVEKLTPDEPGRKTVVHLLNGDAVEFTTAYLTARLAKSPEPAPALEPPASQLPEEAPPKVVGPARVPAPTAPAQAPPAPSPAPSPTPRPRADSDTPAEEPAGSGS
jgi:hypothetical protein